MKTYTLGSTKEEFLDLVPEGKIRKMKIADKTLGLVRKGTECFVFDAFCPHRGALLTDGHINGQNEISCPLHQYRFDLKSGQVTSGYCADLQTYACQITDKGLEITMPV